MTKILEIPCTTKGSNYHGRMFTCRAVVEDLFEGDWTNVEFVACLKRATVGSRRPIRDAVKIKIPTNFVNKGINVEQPDGKFRHNVLTFCADDHVKRNKLQGKNWWVWAELLE